MAVLWLRLCDLSTIWMRVELEIRRASGRLLRFADSLYLNVLDGTLDKRLWRGMSAQCDTVAYPGFQHGGHTKTLAHGRILRAN